MYKKLLEQKIVNFKQPLWKKWRTENKSFCQKLNSNSNSGKLQEILESVSRRIAGVEKRVSHLEKIFDTKVNHLEQTMGTKVNVLEKADDGKLVMMEEKISNLQSKLTE